ncbi:CLUMA_CG011464, isoform A [Clunio marinus]|uniref:CLUMA_CG011464, isoform A n=1 Tax=Clunio marinus TaxID=568069 RepID=A0A1J1ICY2_9DIPT|nr:CLUMA_CG011464, isoform A [Clunio marinus]
MSALLRLLQFTSLLTLKSIYCLDGSLNRPPYFVPGTGDFSTFSIPENFQIGTSVYKLKGVDPEGRKVSYSISGPYFSVERDSGIVKLIKELDREEVSELETIITITDEADDGEEPNTVSLRRIIPIRDFNDNRPTFLGRPYSVKIVETSKIGQVLDMSPIIVIDKDEGINSEVSMTCFRETNEEVDSPCDYFDVITIKKSEGNYLAELRLIKPVDYESRKSYVLTILAQDGSRDSPLTSNATVNINVIDAQDQPPVFYGEPYSVVLQENMEPNVMVLALNVSDGDFGDPNDIIMTLEKEKFGYFKLLKSGKGQAQLVTTDKKIDRENREILENGGYYTFHVKATEALKNLTLGDSTTSAITVMIQDIDDNVAEFNKPSFNLTIPENLEVDTALPRLSIIVNDLDAGVNSRYNLTISNVKNSDGVFNIFPKSGEGRTQVIVKVKDSQRLDYDVDSNDKRMFVFEILATVNHLPVSSTLVEVHLDGVNDNFPIFDESNYRLSVEENSEIGLNIGDIHATDKDVGKFGKLSYNLRGFGAENFGTDVENGGIYVKKTLDYEHQKSYSLSLIAKDGGGRESNANIFIDILDLNDNFPQFETYEYYRSVREGSKSFEPQFFVKAYDVDGATQGNGQISYNIKSENSISGHVFSINEVTGEIFISDAGVHSSDTFDGNYELMICAEDFGHPRLKNYTKVIIRVGSENQRPIFQGHFASAVGSSIPGPPVYSIEISEDSKPETNLTMIQATDPDGDDKLLKYRIMDGTDSFSIDENSGVIKISQYARLDRDVNDNYAIVVHAIDSGVPSETSTATIKVKILDINNKKPKFEKQSYTAYVPERNKGLRILKVTAIDSDLNSKLKYSIIEPVMATTKAGFKLDPTNFNYKSIFNIEEDSGGIILMKNLENSGLYSVTLTVKAQDVNAMNGIEQVDICEVILYVQSYKESGPIFLNDGWNNIEKKIHIKVNEETEIGKEIIKLQAQDPETQEQIKDFEIEPPDGFGYFRLVEDKIIIQQRIDYENIEKEIFIVEVKAISPFSDSFSSAQLVIEIVNINDNNPAFDKESYKAAKQALLKLQVVAEDSLGKPSVAHKTSVTVTIEVLDVNDVQPKFLNRQKDGMISAVVAESSPIETLVINLEAYDPDDGLAGEVQYEIIDEGDIGGLFELNPKTGELKTAKQLTGRGRSEPYEIKVRAIDKGNQIPKQQSLFVDQILQIFIGDTFSNDGIPYFISSNDEEANVTENLPIGSRVYQIQAKDPDDPTTPSGMLLYRIQNDIEDAKYFKIEALSGIITTTRVLDREVKDKYNIIVEVSDQGDPPQASTRVLKINVMDVDDEDPLFMRDVSSKPIELMVLEEQSSGVILGNVTAVDKDIKDNAAIDYEIIDGNELEFFKLVVTNNTAFVTTTKPIDREKFEKFLLIVKCMKKSLRWQRKKEAYSRLYDSEDFSEIQVLIYVIDIDDHLIEFEKDSYSIGIRNTIPLNTLIYSVKAHDADSGSLAIFYQVLNSTFVSQFHRRKDEKFKENLSDIFELNNRTGEIILAKSVSDFVDGHFVLHIRATNTRYNDVIVNIFIVRDKSIMKFVFSRPPMDMAPMLSKFSDKIHENLNGTEIMISMFDAQVLSKPDQIFDFSSTSSCFMTFRNGNLLSLADTQKIMNSEDIKNKLRETYLEYSVDSLGLCSFGREVKNQSLNMTSSGTWLVFLAFLVLVASLVSTLTACCLFRKPNSIMKSPILQQRISSPDIYNVNDGAVIYTEPIYTVIYVIN